MFGVEIKHLSLQVVVSTPLGTPVNAPVTLKRAKRAGSENPFLSNEVRKASETRLSPTSK